MVSHRAQPSVPLPLPLDSNLAASADTDERFCEGFCEGELEGESSRGGPPVRERTRPVTDARDRDFW